MFLGLLRNLVKGKEGELSMPRLLAMELGRSIGVRVKVDVIGQILS
jgi:hypothetical protein